MNPSDAVSVDRSEFTGEVVSETIERSIHHPHSSDSPLFQSSSSASFHHPSSMDQTAEHELVFSGQRLFEFESKYTVPDFSSFCQRHDVIPWTAVSLYLLILFVSLRLMAKRQAFSLKAPLLLWNLMLAAFSMIGFYRMLQEFRYTYQTAGWRGTYCRKSSDNVVGFWIFVFVMSKFVEFGDTVFLVLRKKPVIFLHWYHHVTVLLFSYVTAMDWSSNGRWFVLMNYFVHSLMYSYYALQAAGIRVPRFFAMPLTVMQIMQMFGGMYVITVSGIEDLYGDRSTCPNSKRTLISGFVMYASYMVLFVNFFYQSYILNKKKRQAKKDEAAAAKNAMNGSANGTMTTIGNGTAVTRRRGLREL